MTDSGVIPRPEDRSPCTATWGDSPGQRCTRTSGHKGVHIDDQDREFGWEPDDGNPWGDT